MIKQGELLMLSTEEYSDQSHAGPFKVLKDFDIMEIASIVKSLQVSFSWKKKTGPDDVVYYLLNYDFIELVECHNFHLGSYGDIVVSEV